MSSAKYCQSSVYFMNLHKNKLLQTMHQTKIIEMVNQYPLRTFFHNYALIERLSIRLKSHS